MRDGKHVILCVDDDQDFLDVMRTIIEANGYLMVEANSAEDGLKTYKDHQPDLLFVDLMMEEVDAGANFVRELQLLGNQAPIFMLSSVGDQLNLSADPAALGLAGVLQKPVNANSLLTLLRAKLK
jgi:CheY-like chemotaxis protein